MDIPVVVLHGFASPRVMMRPLAKHLAHALGRPVWRPQLGAGLLDIRDDAMQLQEELEVLLRECGAPCVDLVGHSMGGLVATYLLKYLDLGTRVCRVVTLGTPHRGTPAAGPGVALLGLISPALSQMVPRSDLLAALAVQPVPRGCELVSVAGSDDLLVPPRCAEVAPGPGQWNALVPGVDHFGLSHGRTSLAFIARLLAA